MDRVMKIAFLIATVVPAHLASTAPEDNVPCKQTQPVVKNGLMCLPCRPCLPLPGSETGIGKIDINDLISLLPNISVSVPGATVALDNGTASIIVPGISLALPIPDITLPSIPALPFPNVTSAIPDPTTVVSNILDQI